MKEDCNILKTVEWSGFGKRGSQTRVTHVIERLK